MDGLLAMLETASNLLVSYASDSAARAQAEKTLLDFRNSEKPYALCQYVLEHSSNENTIFQCVIAVKAAVVREWPLLSPSEIEGLRLFLLTYAIQRPSLPSFVREHVFAAVAIMYKRGWLDEATKTEGRATLFRHLQELLALGPEHQLVAFSLMSALLSEFSSSPRSSAVGLPWEFHFATKQSFETEELRDIFGLVVTTLSGMMALPDDALAARQNALQRIMSLAEQVLHWQFLPSRCVRMFGSFEPIVSTFLKPPLSWRHCFNPDLLTLFVTCFQRLAMHEELGHVALQCLIQLVSLSPLGLDEAPRAAYAGAALGHVSALLQHASTYAGHALWGKRLLGLGTCFSKLLTTFEVGPLLQLQSGEPLQAMFKSASAALVQAIDASCRTIDDDLDTCLTEAIDQFLDGFVAVASSALRASHPPQLRDHGASIINAYVQGRLARAAKDALREDEIDSDSEPDHVHMRDQLQGVSIVAREVAYPTLVMLTSSIDDIGSKISQARAANASPQNMAVLYEQMHWLLLISGHVLADSDDGETPEPPQAINSVCMANGGTGVQVVMDLVSAATRVADLEYQIVFESKARSSPLLGSTVLWFLRRWAASYLWLRPNPNSPPIASALWGEGTDAGRKMFDYILRRVVDNMVVWQGEDDVIAECIAALVTLSSPAERKSLFIQSGVLPTLVSFQDPSSPFYGLPDQAQMKLAMVIVRICTAAQDPTGVADRLRALLLPATHQLNTIASDPDSRQLAQQPDTMLRVTHSCQVLNGAFRASTSATAGTILEIAGPALPAAIQLLRLYNGYPEMTALIVNLFVLAVEFLLPTLNRQKRDALYSTCLQMMRVYTGGQTGRRFDEEDRMVDMTAFFQLLTEVTSAEYLDFNCEDDQFGQVVPEGPQFQPMDMVLAGLDMIVPLMTAELLKFPSLSQVFFKLLDFVSDIHPEKIYTCPTNLLTQLLGAVEFALASHTPAISKMALSILSSLCSEHYKLLQRQQANPVFSEAVERQMRMLFEWFVLQPFDMDNLEAAASALFGLVCCNRALFTAVAQELVTRQPTQDQQQRLVRELNDLLTDDGLQLEPDRVNRKKFFLNFSTFLMNVRGFLMCR
eukprot:m.48787 g.48787  ORF g.48787 m.48787 type:complete len:1098 (-) comp6062_c0_seq1:953-4246(-)